MNNKVEVDIIPIVILLFGLSFLSIGAFLNMHKVKQLENIEVLYRADMLQDCKTQNWKYEPPYRPSCEKMVDRLIEEAKKGIPNAKKKNH